MGTTSASAADAASSLSLSSSRRGGNRLTRGFVLGGLFLGLTAHGLATSARAQTPGSTLDQQQTTSTFGTGLTESTGGRPRVGQSFTPTLPSLTDAVFNFTGFAVGDPGSDALYRLDVFLAGGDPAGEGPTGSSLGFATLSGSEVDFGTGLDEVFTFSSPVATTPETKYFLQLSFVDATNQDSAILLGATDGNPYLRGAGDVVDEGNGFMFNDGVNTRDFAFQTYGSEVPEPAGLALLALGGLALARRRRV